MLRFTTNGKKDCTDVFLKADFGTTDPSDKNIFPFKWEANDSHFAYLLAQHFQNQLENAVRRAHRRAYEQGYTDGRQHRARKAYFSSELGETRKPAW